MGEGSRKQRGARAGETPSRTAAAGRSDPGCAGLAPKTGRQHVKDENALIKLQTAADTHVPLVTSLGPDSTSVAPSAQCPVDVSQGHACGALCGLPVPVAVAAGSARGCKALAGGAEPQPLVPSSLDRPEVAPGFEVPSPTVESPNPGAWHSGLRAQAPAGHLPSLYTLPWAPTRPVILQKAWFSAPTHLPPAGIFARAVPYPRMPSSPFRTLQGGSITPSYLPQSLTKNQLGTPGREGGLSHPDYQEATPPPRPL